MDKETEDKIGELIGFLSSSNLSHDDKSLWYDAIKEMPKEGIMTLWLFMKNTPEDLPEATELMKRKRDALSKGDDAAFRKIIEEEAQELKK